MPGFVDIGIDIIFLWCKVIIVHSENCKKNHRIPPPRENTIKLFDRVSSYIFKLKSEIFTEINSHYIFCSFLKFTYCEHFPLLLIFK